MVSCVALSMGMSHHDSLILQGQLNSASLGKGDSVKKF